RAPAAARRADLAGQGHATVPRFSPHAVSIPGSVDAWCRLAADHGTWDMARLLAPAARLAREGYRITPRVAYDWELAADALDTDPDAQALFRDRAYAVGDRHAQPALADTLERIGRDGRDGFYAGLVAEDMVAKLRARGGVHTLDDFAAHAGEWVEPIHTDYRGHRVWECPPNGQGIVALEMLNILAGLPVPGPHSAERLHQEIEAARLAYNDRDALLADTGTPVSALLSDAHARDLRARIDPDRALTDLPPPLMPDHPDTVYLCVVDKDRNAVSLINSLFDNFGSAILAPRSGVMLNNRACCFSLAEGHPNALAPGRRPLHTIIPGMLTAGGRAVMPFGVMGGHYQAVGQVRLLRALLDDGLDPQTALELPRVFPVPGGPVQAEDTLTAVARNGLLARGHRLVKPPKPLGGGQAIWIDHDRGVLIGGSEPRKDGLALGYE
ncbi:MAG: gamma-glutamyltransferase family protein, partial [Rhodobacterales bacterium]|nr:gamma-glutamyltransferase family protein [Rhodobacterales bacterium]